ncbi:DMT family transporter [Parasediminibacterium sp. JCM 36343]|uniref:DMT family transporter n=1 Tax=Parasediminibacterium sp. JCM 36343 TaxID=3374279 RepID=UPI00397CF6A9
MKDSFMNWVLFVVLSLIWGSSFLLMKIGMESLAPYEVAALRILSAGVVLIPFCLKAFNEIPSNKIAIVFLSGLIGNFFPAFLFCLAETKLNSSLTGMINSLTPLCTVVIGILFFKMMAGLQKLIGVLIGLAGLFFLVSPNGQLHFENFNYISLVLLATVMYAVTVNMVSRHMVGIGSINIASAAFVMLIPACLAVLLATGYFYKPLGQMAFIKSTVASCTLGIAGTAFATVLFYRLVKRAGALFGSMVTYGIPFIAAGWGIFYGETVTLFQIGCLGIILSGVYLVNKKPKSI